MNCALSIYQYCSSFQNPGNQFRGGWCGSFSKLCNVHAYSLFSQCFRYKLDQFVLNYLCTIFLSVLQFFPKPWESIQRCFDVVLSVNLCNVHAYKLIPQIWFRLVSLDYALSIFQYCSSFQTLGINSEVFRCGSFSGLWMLIDWFSMVVH